MTGHNVLLPLTAPTTVDLRNAVAAMVRDIQLSHDLTDIQLAGKLDIHPNTVASWRNKKADMGALMVAVIGATFGVDAVAPYHALYGASAHGIAAQDAAPLSQLAMALAKLTEATSHKARLESLPCLKDAAEALNGYILALERWRLAA